MRSIYAYQIPKIHCDVYIAYTHSVHMYMPNTDAVGWRERITVDLSSNGFTANSQSICLNLFTF